MQAFHVIMGILCCILRYLSIYCVFLGLDPEDFESDEKSDKSKNPNSIQSGKWQLGFQGEERPSNFILFFVFTC